MNLNCLYYNNKKLHRAKLHSIEEDGLISFVAINKKIYTIEPVLGYRFIADNGHYAIVAPEDKFTLEDLQRTFLIELDIYTDELEGEIELCKSIQELILYKRQGFN